MSLSPNAELELDASSEKDPFSEAERILGKEGPDTSGSDEIWFSADELARTSEIEIGAAPDGLSAPVSWSEHATALRQVARPFAGLQAERLSPEVCAALAGLHGGRVLHVQADLDELAADACLDLAEQLLVHPALNARVLWVSRRPASQWATHFWARQSGRPRLDFLEADTGLSDRGTSSAEQAWIAQGRSLQLGPGSAQATGPDALSSELAVAQGLRYWLRPAPANTQACPPIVVVPHADEAFAPDAAAPVLEGLRERVLAQGAILVWGARGRATSRDAYMSLSLEQQGKVRVAVGDPQWGSAHLGDGRWERKTGRVFA